MARMLDLNSIQESLLDLQLRDEAHTIVHLDMPTEALINELQHMGPDLERMKTGDQAAIGMIYDLAARLINCNFDGFRATGEELRTKYNMHLVAALTFFSGYMEAIDELIKAKN